MSLSAAHESKDVHRDHTLCFECYRSERDRSRARRLPEPRPARLRSPFSPALNDRQLAHRRLMLQFAHTEGARAAGSFA